MFAPQGKLLACISNYNVSIFNGLRRLVQPQTYLNVSYYGYGFIHMTLPQLYPLAHPRLAPSVSLATQMNFVGE